MRRIQLFRRYLRRQVSISRHRLKRLRIQPEMGPCLRRGLRGESMFSIPQHRVPGGCRGLLPLERGASRERLRPPCACAWACSGQSQCDCFSSAAGNEDPGPWAPMRVSRRRPCPARRAVTLHSVALFSSRRSATAPAAPWLRKGPVVGSPDGERQSGQTCRRNHQWFRTNHKSFQSGLVSSIRRIFHARFHFLIWYSRLFAPSRVS